MKLSIIIVNYNVRYFLDQCLHSIHLAEKSWPWEVIVVDNNSSDDSIEMLRRKYPEVLCVANKENNGFSVACNQGLKLSTGEYVLFLNPDTILRADSLSTPIKKMDSDPEIGALGVKMIDGSGKYLEESKRGLPTPWVAFCKASGLSSLFPKSGFFNRYYMGHLPSDQNAEIEVLCGAFILARKQALIDAGGGFDESYFMYGEDIDLSYRISMAGYKLIYLAETSIIHFKGESTKKTSLSYIKTFYKAMEIFADKHFHKRSKFFTLFLRLGIYIKALFTLLVTFFTGKGLILIDGLFLYVGFYGIQYFLGIAIHGDENYYPDSLRYFNLPVYAFIWLLSLYLSGFYSRFRTGINTITGILIGGLVLLAVYGLADHFLRSSRAVLLTSGIWVLLYSLFSRMIFNYVTAGNWSLNRDSSHSVVLIGDKESILQALEILQFNGYKAEAVIPLSSKDSNDPFFKGSVTDIGEVVHAYRISELIFCRGEINFSQMMEIMKILGHKIRYRILTAEGDSLISSYSSARSGELFTKRINHRLSLAHVRTQKRLLDGLLSLVLLPLFPIILWSITKRIRFIKDWWLVLIGQKTWVSYHPNGILNEKLPSLPPGCLWQPLGKVPDSALIEKYNYNYSVDYQLSYDLEVVRLNLLRFYK